MITKTSDKPLDVSSLIEKVEEKPIIPVESKPIKPVEPAPIRTPQTREMPLEERLKEDLKISYEAKGVLDITFGGYGFLRKNYVLSPDADIYVSTSQIRRFWLRRGDEVEGLARPPKEGERFHSLLLIKKINGVEMTEEQSAKRRNFDQLTSLHPNKQIKLETDKDTLSTRIMDLVSPIGFGQRALIVSQPKAGKTTFLKEIAEAIGRNYPDVYLMAILIGERPEEVTEIKRFIKGEVAASNFDESPRQQIKVANLALDRAKRLVEVGKDVIILLDSVTRLARALNLSTTGTGRSLSGGFDPSALYPAKKFLGAARNCEEGGSLTIIGTALIGTESRMDDLIYEELKGTGNMEIHLDRALADKRIFPSIDVEKSGTRHEELLFDKAILNKVNTLRRMLSLLHGEERTTLLIEKLMKTKNNEDFLESLSKGA
ncbi:transcription termination factor Rho [Microgenomates bacterium UTCPR1]|nr:MAG: transcription termination factor Rho [Microgenomates bacterium UTCPR1]